VVGIIGGGEVGFDEAVAAFCDPVGHGEDVVGDGLVEVLVRFVWDGEPAVLTVGAFLFRLIAA